MWEGVPVNEKEKKKQEIILEEKEQEIKQNETKRRKSETQTGEIQGKARRRKRFLVTDQTCSCTWESSGELRGGWEAPARGEIGEGCSVCLLLGAVSVIFFMYNSCFSYVDFYV